MGKVKQPGDNELMEALAARPLGFDLAKKLRQFSWIELHAERESNGAYLLRAANLLEKYVPEFERMPPAEDKPMLNGDGISDGTREDYRDTELSAPAPEEFHTPLDPEK